MLILFPDNYSTFVVTPKEFAQFPKPSAISKESVSRLAAEGIKPVANAPPPPQQSEEYVMHPKFSESKEILEKQVLEPIQKKVRVDPDVIRDMVQEMLEDYIDKIK